MAPPPGSKMPRRNTRFCPRFPFRSGKFILFPQLPLEIREMIWVNAIPEPRLIEISCRESTKPRDGVERTMFVTKTMLPQPYRDQAPHTYFTARPLPHEYPALLRTTSESRAVMLNIYRPCFAKEFGGRPIYIDLSRDTIYFRNPISLLSFYGIEQPCQFNYSEFTNELLAIVPEEPNDIERCLKSIAINWGWGGSFTCAVLCRFQSLEEVVFQNFFTINRQPYREIDLSRGVSELTEAFKKAAKDRGIASTRLELPIIECVPLEKIFKRFQKRKLRYKSLGVRYGLVFVSGKSLLRNSLEYPPIAFGRQWNSANCAEILDTSHAFRCPHA